MPRGQHVLVCACLRNVLLTSRPYDVGSTLGPCGMRKQVWLVLEMFCPLCLAQEQAKLVQLMLELSEKQAVLTAVTHIAP